MTSITVIIMSAIVSQGANGGRCPNGRQSCGSRETWEQEKEKKKEIHVQEVEERRLFRFRSSEQEEEVQSMTTGTLIDLNPG